MTIERALVAFPYANGKQGSWAENFTALWTAPFRWAWFGHVELHFLCDGIWFRATATTDTGAVFTPTASNGQPLEFDPKSYCYMELPTDFPSQAAIDFAWEEMCAPGNAYDWNGIWHWVCGLVPPSKTKWYCSEITAAMLKLYPPYAVFGNGDGQWSPNGVYRQIKKLGLKEITALP